MQCDASYLLISHCLIDVGCALQVRVKENLKCQLLMFQLMPWWNKLTMFGIVKVLIIVVEKFC